ncbi:hypothetical protein JCGZ_15789 [Jatropha curcas]|uniref:Uncharacterized protein n=1 Tax=Jatropha curcas TaxID=180498 RepID=A0A067KYZ5_JATCU|nr:hypothetical protein JCGZ_15789 [Jatropha curcas]
MALKPLAPRRSASANFLGQIARHEQTQPPSACTFDRPPSATARSSSATSSRSTSQRLRQLPGSDRAARADPTSLCLRSGKRRYRHRLAAAPALLRPPTATALRSGTR